MTQPTPGSTPRPEDRRVHQRHEVCVPVLVRLLDERGEQPISDPGFGVIRDVSAGGLRLDVLGELAQWLSGATPGAGQVELRFVPPELAALPPARGRVRWARPAQDGPGWVAGLQYGLGASQTRDELLVALVEYGAAPLRQGLLGPRLRKVLVAGLVACAFAAGAQLGNQRREVRQRRERRLERQVDALAEDHASCMQRVGAVWRRHDELRTQLDRCRGAAAAATAAPAAP
ncbi:MAG: PilZ domain-containing protein [Proteobacteria bacterium]|nr:PilZ domain-containing protein [Pseudomonadota bacterium]